MKLRARLSIFSVLLIVVLVAGISAGTIFFLRKLFRAELQQNQHTTLMNFRQVCEEAEEVRDPIIASNYVKTLEKTVPGLAYAVFVNERLELMIGENAVFDKLYPFFSRAAERTASPRSVRVSSGDDILEWSSEVTVNGVIGLVRIGYFQDVIDRTVGQKVNEVQRIVFLVAAVGLVLAIFAAVWMSAQLTEPIARLAEGAKSLGDGNLDTRIDIERKDEFGFLADEFNIMAEKLKELDHLKDEFVSSVSHELRSPLAAIAGYVELLTRKPLEQILPEKRTKAFGIIQESTQRLTQFINDILDLAKIKAGRVEIRKTPFQSPKALEEILGLFQPLFEKKHLTGRLDAPADIPVVPADEEKIKQVITNLVSNAYKFTPEGGHHHPARQGRAGRGGHRRGGHGDRHSQRTRGSVVRALQAGARHPGALWRSEGDRTGLGDLQGHRVGPRRQDLGRKRTGTGQRVFVLPAQDTRGVPFRGNDREDFRVTP